MRKTLFISCLLFIVFLTFSCSNTTNSPDTPVLQKDFTLDTFITDDALFQENSKLYIRGYSEPGVMMEAQILDHNNKVVSTNKVVTDKKTNIFNITLNSPKGSKQLYKLEVYDSNKKHVKTFNNIVFGKLFLFVGDQIKYTQNEIDHMDYSDLSNLYYLNLKSLTKWSLINEIDNINKLLIGICNNLNKEYDMPVGIMDLSTSNSSIEQWLSLDSVNDKTKIKNYLLNENKYNDSITNESDMCYYYETYLSKFIYTSVESILFNHYQSDLNKILNSSFTEFYFHSLISIMETLHNDFNNSFVYILGASSSSSNEVSLLRNIQNSSTNYLSYAALIPTFDLNNRADNLILDCDLSKLVSRISSMIVDELTFSKYANLIYITNEEEVVTKIQIELSDTLNLNILQNNKDLESENIIINYLDIYYKDPINGLIKLTDVYSIRDNFIIIDLEYEDIEIVNEEELIVNKIYDKNLISISYGQYGNLLDFNLVNDSNLPIIPFQIILK